MSRTRDASRPGRWGTVPAVDKASHSTDFCFTSRTCNVQCGSHIGCLSLCRCYTKEASLFCQVPLPGTEWVLCRILLPISLSLQRIVVLHSSNQALINKKIYTTQLFTYTVLLKKKTKIYLHLQTITFLM